MRCQTTQTADRIQNADGNADGNDDASDGSEKGERLLALVPENETCEANDKAENALTTQPRAVSVEQQVR